MRALDRRERDLVRAALGDPSTDGPAWLDALVDTMTTLSAPAGTPVLEHGDGHVVVVLDGLVEVRVGGRLVAHPGPGAVLGALRGRTLAPGNLAVSAATQVRLALAPADAVRDAVRRDTRVADRVHARVARSVLAEARGS